jgi:hypothetical protein
MPEIEAEELMKVARVADVRDNRRHNRLRLDTTVRYKVINRQSVAKVRGLRPDGNSVNISVSGLAVLTETPLKSGDFLKVELSLPGMTRATRALAEVVWSRLDPDGNLAGIRFLILLNEADDSSIRRFMEFQHKGEPQ